jgi:hypothetical protein
MKRKALYIMLLVFLSSCAPTPEQIAMPLQATLAAISTNTFFPTYTQYPTYTLYPTYTAIPTSTVTITPSPIPSSTKTPTPKVTQTYTLEPATRTAQAKITAMTATAFRKALLSTEVAEYKPIDWRELQSYADNHIGEKVYIRGRVFNIPPGGNHKELQLYFAGTYEAFYVTTRDSFTGVYENDSLIIYGVIEGQKCFQNKYNAEICQPSIIKAFIVR